MTNKIKCKYIFAENYNPVYINGAYGGVSPRGEIVVNFFFERGALPNSQTFNIEGAHVKEIESEREPQDLPSSFVRVVSSGIILDYANAKVIHEWLGNHIKKLENKANDRIRNKK